MTLRLWGGALAPEDVAPEDGVAIGPALRERDRRRYAPRSTTKLWDEPPEGEEEEVRVRFAEPGQAPEEAAGGEEEAGGAELSPEELRARTPVRISWRKPTSDR